MTLESLGYSPSQNTVLKEIYKKPGITRKELSECSGISARTILKFISEFLENGIVVNHGKCASTGGRNAEKFAVNPDFMYALAVDVGSYVTKIGVVNLHGEVIKDEFIPSKNENLSSCITPSEVRNRLSLFIEEFGKERFMGIGMSISGLVDKNGKRIEFSPNIPGFTNIDTTLEFENKLGLPIVLDTSSRSLALAEQSYGFGKDYNNQVYVSVGHSISSGIIISGRLFGGSNGGAGEIGHVKCGTKGVRCSCGNFDCLEVYSTLPMIIANVKKELKTFSGYSPVSNLVGDIDTLTWQHLSEGLRLKDRVVSECIVCAGKRIGYALSHLINTLNPEIIVFGGSVTELLPEVIDEAISSASEFALISSVQNLKMEKSILGTNAAIIGSGVQVMNRFFGC